ncbi:MAG: hypothetical protein WBD20_24180 [Pirellulaceae bacterium]
MKIKLSLFLITLVSFSHATLARADELTIANFKQLHQELQASDTALWRTIPWQTDLLETQRLAATQGKPIFIWAMDGHPLGCT